MCVYVCREQIVLIVSKTKLHFSQARINRTNLNTRSLRIKRKYLHDFSALAYSLSYLSILTPSPFLPPEAWYALSLTAVPSLEFANPYLALCTVSRQTSLTDFTPVDFHDLLLRRICPPSLFSALIARLPNCHFLRQIVLSRVGVTDTRIKLAEEKKRKRATGGRRGKGKEGS